MKIKASCEANESREFWKSIVGTGLNYFSARYQDPKLGIFLGVDELKEKYPGVSSYAYCLNNPLRFVDPDGRGPFDWFVNNVTGAVVHVEGQSKLTQDTANKIGAGDAENYDRLGADDMFGNENEKANKIRELGASRIENPENFMNRQGYKMADQVEMQETTYSSKGAFGEENISNEFTVEKILSDSKITYVKPEALNKKTNISTTENNGSLSSIERTSYTYTTPHGKEKTSSSSGISSFISVSLEIISGFLTEYIESKK